MNTFMSLKRSTRTDKAAQATKGVLTPDPLLDSTVALDEIPEEHFSTLKFLDTKREQEKQASSPAQPVQAIHSAPVTQPKTKPVTTLSHTPVGNAALNVTPNIHNTQKTPGKPSRMNIFRDRVLLERTDTTPLPFLSHAGAQCGRSTNALVNLTPLAQATRSRVENKQTNPFGALIHASLKNAERAMQSHGPSQTDGGSRAGVATGAVVETDIAQTRYCLTRATDSMECLLTDFLRTSRFEKPLTVQLAAADGFDFCAGAADLFTPGNTLAVHRITEDDHSRHIQIATSSALWLDSMTAAHAIRHRPLSMAAFAGWFDEDGFACDRGFSPIETFVQAELLTLSQQVQRMFKQAHRLAQHLKAHCPDRNALEALHDRAQADAWVAQYGNAPQPSLYRLLDCQLTDPFAAQFSDSQPAQTESKSLLSFWARHPDRMPSLRDVALPHLPAGLQLIRALARATEATAPNVGDFEQLAILDLLLRKPALPDTGGNQGNQGNRADLGCVTPDVLSAWHVAVVQRFPDLGARLQSAGLSE